MNPTIASLDSILMEAVEIAESAERQAFVDRACAGDTAMKAQVERLIANHFRAGSFLDHPAAFLETAAFPAQGVAPGTRIGPYKLLEQIGEGGMGLVYLAEQHHPVRRTVALKVIKPGMDSRQVVSRFEAERQAIALMDHPNIAKVLDAGTTEAGRPYFVMELVRGVPITEYCDQARLNIRQRLEVFVQVCRAVQHAHTKGVIHRDIKPSNVLVTSHDGAPVPLVIDFGVAKALGKQLTDQTLHTGFAQMIGTPLYMSPEQAEFNQLGVDTRCDIYSLGVLLYELLTGQTPFDREQFRTANYDEFRRILCEQEPPRPSARLSTLGAALTTASDRRGVDPRKLTQMLHGELDWIVLKALEKDRDRRYETASAFAADVQRYLSNEAVEACPPSATYRLRKFARRNRGPLVAGGMIAAVVLAAISAVAFLNWRQKEGLANAYGLEKAAREDEQAQRERADRKAKLARAAVDKMYTDVAEDLLAGMPATDPLRLRFLEDALAFYRELGEESGTDPGARDETTRLHLRIARLERWLGRPEKAMAATKAALALYEGLAAEFPAEARYRREIASCQADLAMLMEQAGRSAEAEMLYLCLLEAWPRLHEGCVISDGILYNLATIQFNLGSLLLESGKPAEAERVGRDSLASIDRLATEYPDFNKAEGGPLVVLRAGYRSFLASICFETGKGAEGEQLLRHALVLLDSLPEKERGIPQARKERAHTLNNLGWRLAETGRSKEAEAAYRQAIGLLVTLTGEFPHRPEYWQNLFRTQVNLANLLRKAKRTSELILVQRQAAETATRLVAAFPGQLKYQNTLSNILHDLGMNLLPNRPKEAGEAFARSVRILEKLCEASIEEPIFRERLAEDYANFGRALVDSGEPRKGADAYGRAVAIFTKLYVANSQSSQWKKALAENYFEQGWALKEGGKPLEAETALQQGVVHMVKLVEEFPTKVSLKVNLAMARHTLGELITGAGKKAEAEQEFRRALDLWDQVIPLAESSDQAGFRVQRAISLVRFDPAKAVVDLELALKDRSLPGAILYDAACVVSLAAAVDAAQRESYGKRAVELLAKCQEGGYFKDLNRITHMINDPDLKPIRQRADYRALVKQLQ